MREWQEDNAENLAALATRRQQQAAANPPAPRPVEAPLTFPANTSPDVRRLAELRREQVRRLRAQPSQTAGELTPEAAVARREAVRAALGPLEEEGERLEANVTETIETNIIQGIHERNQLSR